jgi:phosphoserine aminotransferase
MISLYPGPSQVARETKDLMSEAVDSGILGMNHRSRDFMSLLRKTKKVLRKKLLIPEEYEIVITSSATECWEIIAQSLTSELSYHLYNGAFGEKWFNYTRKIHSKTLGLGFDPEEELSPRNLDLSEGSSLICLTHNETSNGTCISTNVIRDFRDSFPEPLIAVDATSSMAGDLLNFEDADVWYASVQKCFGLPSGMAVMILSPRAVETAYEINERNHYNSLAFILDNFSKNQTHYTPNILGIYLLYRVIKRRRNIEKISSQLIKRMEQLDKTIKKSNYLEAYIENKAVRSNTVMAVKGERKVLTALKHSARQNGFLLGNGYGRIKDQTIRIANFPAVSQDEWKALRQFIKNFDPSSSTQDLETEG